MECSVRIASRKTVFADVCGHLVGVSWWYVHYTFRPSKRVSFMLQGSQRRTLRPVGSRKIIDILNSFPLVPLQTELHATLDQFIHCSSLAQYNNVY